MVGWAVAVDLAVAVTLESTYLLTGPRNTKFSAGWPFELERAESTMGI